MNLWRTSLLAVVVAAGLMGAVDDARAQDPADRTGLARALFEEGLRLGEQEQWEEAADRFRRAYDLVPSPGIAANLASALIPLGRLVEARGLLLVVVDDPDASAGVRQLAHQLLDQEVEPQIGWLTVHVRGPAEGVRVVLDDAEVPPAELRERVPVDPGRHTVAAMRGEDPVASREVVVAVAGSATVTLRVPPSPLSPVVSPVVTPGSPPGEEPAGRRPLVRTWWFWTAVVGAVAITGIAVGVAAGSGGSPDPITGNTDPPVVEGRVAR